MCKTHQFSHTRASLMKMLAPWGVQANRHISNIWVAASSHTTIKTCNGLRDKETKENIARKLVALKNRQIAMLWFTSCESGNVLLLIYSPSFALPFLGGGMIQTQNIVSEQRGLTTVLYLAYPSMYAIMRMLWILNASTCNMSSLASHEGGCSCIVALPTLSNKQTSKDNFHV